MNTVPDPIRTLRKNGCTLTRQRLLVLDILKDLPGHPDAGMIFQEAKKRDARISLATVYRSLSLLKEAGLVEENRLGEGHGHFETIQEHHHYHFTCVECGRVIELEAADLPDVLTAFAEDEGLRLTEIQLHLRGYCPDCEKKKT